MVSPDENPDHQIPALWLAVFVLSPFSLCLSRVHPWNHDSYCSELRSLKGLPPGGHTDGHWDLHLLHASAYQLLVPQN